MSAVTRAVPALLGLLAIASVVVRFLLPGAWMHLAPALLAIGSAATAVVLAWLAARLPGRSRLPWAAIALAVALLAAGRTLATLRDVGISAAGGGVEDLPQLAAVPLAVAACLLLMPRRSSRGARSRVWLDGFIALVVVAVVVEVVLGDALLRTGTVPEALISVGYPAVGVLLCGLAVVTVVRADRRRRRAAGWLLATVVALAVVAVASALARLLGNAVADLVAQLAWLAMLALSIRAAGSDPGEPATVDEEPGTPPMRALLVSSGATYGVVLLLGLRLAAGIGVTPFEALAMAVLVPSLFLRTLLWTVDAARVTRRLQRAEEYFRALVHSAEDLTVVLDPSGTVTWVSGAARAQVSWSADELTGRRLTDFLHRDDRNTLHRIGAAVAAGAVADLPAGVRMRTPDEDWRDVEISGAVRAGVPGGSARDGLVLHLRDVTSRRSDQRELERLAYTDYLTGLPNRARFMAALEASRVRAADGEPTCVLLVDLDGFKAVNDVAGHDAGDQLLRHVASLLRDGARDRDLVARLGGDEFALLVPGGSDEATRLAGRLVALLHCDFRASTPGDGGNGPVFAVSGSVGVAQLQPGAEAGAAVRQADLALRAAKAAGKNCVRSSGQAIDSAMGRRTRLARDLPAALEENQLRLEYQPVVCQVQRRIVGLEALVRWEHPLLGTVPPDEFIALAEEDGLIVPLQRWVLGTAAADAASLMADGIEVQMGVNVSVRHLQAGCLAPDVAAALAAAGLPPRKLVLEITESVLLDAEDRLESDLATLRDMGCVLALDDFGQGYSSLAYLARLPVQVLKMDREFIAGIERDERVAALVASVVGLGRTLGLDVVAEGVETPSQLAALRGMDCRYLQGYLLGRPVPYAGLRARLAEFDAALLDAPVTAEMDGGVHLVGRDG